MKIGMLNWWQFTFFELMAGLGLIRFAEGGDGGDGGGDGGPGGEHWSAGVEGLGEGVGETLAQFETPAAAYEALHSGSRPLVDRVIGMDPELEANKETLSRFEDSAKLAKSYLELRSKLGENPIVPPGEGATDEQRAEFNQRLNALRGVPESADDYKPEIPEDINKLLDPEQFKGRMGELHKLNLDDDQLQGVLNMFFEEAGYMNSKAAEAHEAWKTETAGWAKEQWGNEAEANTELAHRAMRKMGVFDDLSATGFINKKGVIDSYYQLARSMGEGNLPNNAGDGGGGSFDEQLAALQANPAYSNPRHPDYQSLQDKKAALYKKFHG